MEQIFSKTTTKIFGNKNRWSLESDKEEVDVTETEISLEIQGTKKHGYNLVMSPKGFFTADYYYSTKEEALEDALDLFGVKQTDWKKGNDLTNKD